jgi:hypothetical protein
VKSIRKIPLRIAFMTNRTVSRLALLIAKSRTRLTIDRTDRMPMKIS